MKILRILVYLLGLIVLALGLVLNTKAGLGSAPLVSTAYCASQLSSISFANASFIVYSVFVLIEIILHLCRNEKKRLLNDLLQLPFALVFTRFMGLFDRMIPSQERSVLMRSGMLILAVILIGIGACLSMRMRLIPNPGDGVVLAISDASGMKLGLTKNVFDISNVFLAGVIGLIARGKLVGIGIGTVVSMLCVGRVIDICGRILAPLIEKLVPDKPGNGSA